MRKTISRFLTALVCVAGFATVASAQVNVIPQPAQVKIKQGQFTLNKSTQIVVDRSTKPVGEYLAKVLRKSTGYKLPVVQAASGAGNSIIIWAGGDAELGKESYKLNVTPDVVTIISPTANGAFYGMQTLRQLFPAEVESPKVVKNVRWSAPVCEIIDFPRFAWRGMHLDVGRHMFSVEDIKKYIDLLAMHKMNKFHWHLTEDQGWRIEIKKYPKLTTVGSKRDATPIPANRKKLDGKKYGGFYTQKEVREIVAYAKARYVTVIPEIDIPGHTQAVLAAYPKLGCTGGPYKVRTMWGISREVLCAGNPEVYKVMKDVFDEVLELFPSKVIHIGGDECKKKRWKACPKCQAMIRKKKLRGEKGLQSYFIKEMEKYLNSKGRKIIGWDEILEGGLAPNAMVMSWRGVKGGLRAARMKHYVVMSPGSHCYLDHYQCGKPWTEPPAWGGHSPLSKTYSFEPIPRRFPEDFKKYILGVQGNVWTEYMPTFKQVLYMAYPRGSAISEVGWSQKSRRNYKDFRKRLNFMFKRMDLMKVGYRKPKADDARRYRKPRKTLKPTRPRPNRPHVKDDKNKPIVVVPRIKLIRSVLFEHSFGVAGKYQPGYLFDGKMNTFFKGNKPLKIGDRFDIIFKTPEKFSKLKLISGKEDYMDKSRIHGAVVEVSLDGKTFKPLGKVDQDGYFDEELPEKPIKVIRIRITKAQKTPVIIREMVIIK